MNDRVKKGFCLLLTVAVVASMTVVVPLSTAQPSDYSSAPVKGVVKSLKLSKKKVSLESGKKKTVKVKVKTKGPASKKIKVKRTKAAKKVLKKVKVKKPNKKGVSKIKLRAKEVTKQKTVKLKVKTKARNAKGKHIKKTLKVTIEAIARGNVDVDLTSDYATPPKVESIAAYGDIAILVQMLGGKGALAAADEELLYSKFTEVFKDHGSSDIATGWSDDGETSDNIDIDAIIKSGAEALLVTSGSYLTSPQEETLNKGGVTVVQLYEMTNSTYIKNNATTIGRMLSKSKRAEYNAKHKASDYCDFFDDTIEDCCKVANGGKNELAGTKIYEKKNSTDYDYDDTAKYTLLIDDYDTTATYTTSIDGWNPYTNGAALSTVGYATTPASFYIQAGGLVNNAAYKGGNTSGQIIDWQFNSDMAPFNKVQWSYSRDGAVANSINVSVGSAGGWNKSLLTTQYESSNTETPEGNFGTDTFPKAIAATQQIKEKFITNSQNSNGMYHPFGLMTESPSYPNRCGRYTSGGSSIISTIGVDNSDSYSTQVFSSDGASNDGAIPDENVCVNPHGLFSSWTEGGSPESFLEAAWVNDVVNDDSESVGWENYVRDFYKDFYDYDLTSSDLKTIEAGIEK